MAIVWRAFSLPVLEPLTSERLEQIVTITLGCLHAAVCAATANTIVNLTSPNPLKATGAAKDEETESMGASLVEKAVSVGFIAALLLLITVNVVLLSFSNVKVKIDLWLNLRHVFFFSETCRFTRE